MKNRFQIIASWLQIIVGVLGIIGFVAICVSGNYEAKWIMTMFLSISFVGIGIFNLVSENKKDL